MRFRLCIFAALVLSAGTTADAQDVTAVLARAKAASGGTHWDEAKTLLAVGEKSSGGIAGPWRTLEDLGNGHYVQSSRTGAFETAEGYDGNISWRRDPGGEVGLLDGAVALRHARSEAWLTARSYWQPDRLPATYSAVKPRVLENRHYNVISATPQGGDTLELWFDANSGLLARVLRPAEGGSIAIALDDYRSEGGLRLPHHAVADVIDSAGRVDPRRRDEVRVQRFVVNTPASDADFAPPAMPADSRIDNAEGTTHVPFDLVNNHVYADALIDGKPARFIVDTGAVNLLIPAAAKRLGLSSAGRFSTSGSGDNDPDLGFTRGKSLHIGDAVISDPVFYVVDLTGQLNSEGVPYDGYIGYETFRRFGTTFDYAGRTLTLTEPARYQPPSGATELKFVQNERAPILAGTLDGIPLRLWVDSGSRTSLSLQSPFVLAHGLIEKYGAGPNAVIGWGIGGAARLRPARLGVLTIGDLKIEGLAGDLSTTQKGGDASPDDDAILGGGTLRRFAFGLDYAGKRLYLAPNAEYHKADPFDRSGLWLQADGDVLRIADVAAGSPGEKASLRENDRVTSIDGEAVAKRSLSEWRSRLRELPPGTHVAVGFERGGKAGRAELILADRIAERWKPR